MSVALLLYSYAIVLMRGSQPLGGVAQLRERLNAIQEVTSSTPLSNQNCYEFVISHLTPCLRCRLIHPDRMKFERRLGDAELVHPVLFYALHDWEWQTGMGCCRTCISFCRSIENKSVCATRNGLCNPTGYVTTSVAQ